MYPFTPATPPRWTEGATTFFSRLRTVALTYDLNSATEDFAKFSQKLNLAPSRVNILTNGPRNIGTALRNPFSIKVPATPEDAKLGLKQSTEMVPLAEGEKMDLIGSFGHIVWPLYHSSNKDETRQLEGMGPAMKGPREAADFIRWRQKSDSVAGVFLPA